MSLAKLPAEVNGEWIWQVGHDAVDSYVFFRREFALDQIPTSAEFWIAANSNYHVYVNGRHIARGPHPSDLGSAMVANYEMAYCLQYGRNVISVLAHNEEVSRYSNNRKPGALWCQLQVDGTPLLSTDSEWRVHVGDCYLSNRPRISSADGFTETVNMQKYPHGWNEIDYQMDNQWSEARTIGPVKGGRWKLKTLPEVERVSEHYDFLNLVIYGHASPNRALTSVAYPRAATHPGVYVAETFIHSGGEADDLTFQVFTDDPFYLYVNHKLVMSRGKRGEIPNWSDPNWVKPLCYGQDFAGAITGSIPVREGANRLKLVQQVDESSAGATIVFPEVEAGGFRFARGKDAISMPGWTVTGPLNVPFAKVTDSMNLRGKPVEFFYTKEPTDAAANLVAHEFVADDIQEEGMPIDEVELEQGQYMILELERYLRCNPEMEISSLEGDIIDIVYGDALDGEILNPIKGGVRKVYTILGADGTYQWQGIGTHGMRYMMIYCRKAEDKVIVNNVGVRRVNLNLREPASFTCSDELMNQIWEVGQNTLRSTYDSIFLNAGGHQEYQFLADAMLQGLSSLFVFGSPDYSERALRDFADAQFETGEIPVIAPGDYKVRLLDGMMMWPVWLARHLDYTGDKKLAKDMIPHLEQLLVFLEEMAGSDGVLLGNQEPPFENDCIIDYDETLDRRGVSTALNGFYCYALLKAGSVFQMVGDDDKVHYCGKLASEIAKAMRSLTWVEEKGLFADTWFNGSRSSSFSMQANVVALASGIAPEENYDKIFNNIFIDYAPFQNLESDPHSDNPYFKFFLLDMAYALGHREWATDFMRYYWGSMIQQGAKTWWEKFSPALGDGENNCESYCHGYGVSANYFIISEVLGVRPVEPGYYQIYFDPHLTAVEWATASIPTPHGNIKLDWRFLETGQLEVTIEATYPLEVVPQLDKAVASDTVLKVGESVTILN